MIKLHRKPLLLLLSSAALYVLAFPNHDFALLGWICLVPAFEAWRRAQSFKQALLYGAVLQFLISILGFYWVAHVLSEYGRLPFALGVLGLAGFGFIGQPQFLLVAPLFWWALRVREKYAISPHGFWFGFAAVYAGVDGVIPKLFVDTLGHSQYQNEVLRQAASIGGVALLSFLMLLVNGAVWELSKKAYQGQLRSKTEWTGLFPLYFGSFLLILVALGFGQFEKRFWQTQTERARADSLVTLAGIQANIGDLEKFASEQGGGGIADRVVRKYLELSKVALQSESRPQALIWPETAYPSTFGTPDTSGEVRRDQAVRQFVGELGTPLWFGGYDRDRRKDFNAMFFLSEGGSDDPSSEIVSTPVVKVPSLHTATYRKNILLLFGEYLPGSEWFPSLKRAFPQVGNFGKGNGPEVFALPLKQSDPSHLLSTLRVAPAICYEVLFSDFIAQQARAGAELLVNITNDSWFGLTSEPSLHLALSTFRAIETRRPLLRVTNTGISALVLPDGSIAAKTGQNRPEILDARIPVLTAERRSQGIPESGVVKWGPWAAPVLLGIGGAWVLILWTVVRRASRVPGSA
jgi:apolipoprotein N-acyltransferase